MLNQVSEQKAHGIRLILVVGWLLLIASLFFDPISQYLTDPNTNFFSPLKDQFLNLAQDPATCVRVQGKCLPGNPYPAGARIFWGMVVPMGVVIIFVLGHEFWRRICPLYFLSQIPRALKLQPKKQISQNKWLTTNHLYLQFGLFFLGLNMRILFVNSARPVLGGFLLFTIGAAITMNYFYGGRSWCHYVCPFGMVQLALTGPRGLLGSEAHKQPPRTATQSMCRTFDAESKSEKITCISCKSHCMDIDVEKTYWEELNKPGRTLVHYGYLGLVCGYFLYAVLYPGNFDYYFSGAWAYDEGQVGKIFNPGFYIGAQAIPLPKLIAAPLTLAVMTGVFYLLLSKMEQIYRKSLTSIDKGIIRHRMFTLVTFLAVNIFGSYGGRTEILRLPFIVQMIVNGLIVLVSTLWLVRTWSRTHTQYKQESIADKLRRQLLKLKLDFTQILGGRSLNELKAGELDLLAQVLPQVTKQQRKEVYQGVLAESIQTGNVDPNNSLQALQSLRRQLAITEEEHYALLTELGIDDPSLLMSPAEYGPEERFRLESYKEAIASLLQELVDSGIPVHEAVQAKTQQIAGLRAEYHINKEEHLQVLSGLFDALRPKAEKLLALLQVESARYQAICNFKGQARTPVFLLLRKLLLAKQQLIVTPLLAVLELLYDEPDGVQLAQRTGIVAGEAVSQVLKKEPQWQQRLNPQILTELLSGANSNQITLVKSSGAVTKLHDESLSAQAVDDVLTQLIQEPNPITEAASLYALNQLNHPKAEAQAKSILQQSGQNDLAIDIAQSVLGQSRKLSVIEQLLSISNQAQFAKLSPEELLALVTQARKEQKNVTEIASPNR